MKKLDILLTAPIMMIMMTKCLSWLEFVVQFSFYFTWQVVTARWRAGDISFLLRAFSQLYLNILSFFIYQKQIQAGQDFFQYAIDNIHQEKVFHYLKKRSDREIQTVMLYESYIWYRFGYHSLPLGVLVHTTAWEAMRH